MPDKRRVDELSIEELERILAMRKREERQRRMQKMQRDGRVVVEPVPAPASPSVAPGFIPPPMPPETPYQAPHHASSQAPLQPALQPALSVTGNGVSNSLNLPYREAADPRAGLHFEDDLDDADYIPPSKDAERSWKRFVNRSLLLVEIAAVAGLVYLGANLFGAIGTLERETANAAALADQQRRAGIPTAVPTPQLTLAAVVLPTGHSFTADGAPQFNYAEVPAHLLSVVQEQVLQPPPRRPVPSDQTPLRLIVPRLNVDQTIIQGVDWEALRQGIGQVPNGATPVDENSNIVLAAHNDIYGEYFRYLDQLEAGDQFQIQTRTQTFTYTVTGWEIVDPSAVEVMDPRGRPTATLISCYPYRVNNKRIVVFADLTA